MFRSYLTIGWRNLARNRWLAFINIAGLALGITVAMLNGLWVWDELSFNKVHANYDRIAQVVKSELDEGTPDVGSTMQYPAGTELRTTYASQFKSVVRTTFLRNYILSTDEFKKSVRGLFADPEIGAMLSLRMKWGSADALTNPDAVLLPVRISRALFGDANPLGRTLSLNSKTLVTVGGVYEDLPLNSSFQEAEYLASWNLYLRENPWIEQRALTDWRNHFIKIYVEVTEEDDIERISNQIRNLELDHITDSAQVAENPQLFLYPMSRWHLYPFGDGLKAKAEPVQLVALVGAIGAFVLLLACINFMNLSTARSANRAKEIGVRKTVGARRSRLMGQFFTESFLYCVIAVLIAFAFVHVLLAPFNLLSGKHLSVSMLYQPIFLLGFLGLAFFIGLLSGSYPAFYLTAFQPVDVLKGRLRAGSRNSSIRNTLVIFQFCVSISLIISSMMVYFQLSYLQNQDVGFQKENVVGLMHTMNLGKQAEAFKEEVLKYPEFVAASFSSRLPPNVDWGSTFRTETGDENYPMSVVTVDHDHLKTLGLTMVQGRFFSRDFITDSTAVVINETAARQFGLAEPVGSYIRYTGSDAIKMKVIGVVRDFNFETLKSTIRPMVMFLHTGANWDIAVRLSEGNTIEKIQKLGEIWKKFAPNSPFEYSFIDQNFDLKFRTEERLSHVILIFTTLAIFIACLGLLGLATFTAEQRAKEIGIRKVFGATVTQVMVLLSKDFVRLILISLVIAIPITWYAINQWLEGFAYRVDFSIPLVIVAGAVAVIVALLTVSWQSMKAALENPVNALKGE